MHPRAKQLQLEARGRRTGGRSVQCDGAFRRDRRQLIEFAGEYDADLVGDRHGRVTDAFKNAVAVAVDRQRLQAARAHRHFEIAKRLAGLHLDHAAGNADAKLL